MSVLVQGRCGGKDGIFAFLHLLFVVPHFIFFVVSAQTLLYTPVVAVFRWYLARGRVICFVFSLKLLSGLSQTHRWWLTNKKQEDSQSKRKPS
jgi:hypothetical protein